MIGRKVIILAISGPSSSGKTTLSGLLRSVIPVSCIIHEDDFFLPEDQLPFRSGFRDWDCVAALDIPKLLQVLGHVKESGVLPTWQASMVDYQESSEPTMDKGMLELLKRRFAARLAVGESKGKGKQAEGEIQIVILEGFLLFGNSVSDVRKQLDIKIWLRSTYETTKERREKRKGYETKEGWWEEPPGYVEKVVWPAYIDEHGFLFEEGDVEGKINEAEVAKQGIMVCPGGGIWRMEQVLSWVIDTVIEELKE